VPAGTTGRAVSRSSPEVQGAFFRGHRTCATYIERGAFTVLTLLKTNTPGVCHKQIFG
jgi:hypothetical protein